MLWELILEVYGSDNKPSSASRAMAARECAVPARINNMGFMHSSDPMIQVLQNVDYVPCTLPPSLGNGKIVIFEDNDAVIMMIIKGRSPNMRHVP